MSNVFNEDNRSIIIKTCSFLAKKTKDRLEKSLSLPKNTNLEEYLKKDLEKSDLKNLIIKIENFEYDLNYSYNFLFKINDFEEIKNLIKSDSFLKGKINNKETDYLSTKIEYPTLKYEDSNGSNIFFKFSKIIISEKRKIKLPCILFLNFTDKYVQLKIRRVPNNFQLNNPKIYSEIVEDIKVWFYNTFNIKLESKDIFLNAVEIFKNSFYGKDNLKTFISPESFNCNDPQNGLIRMRTNEKNLMPILSELKDMASRFKDQEDQIELTNYLDNLIKNVDYYKIKLNYKINEKKITLEFTRKYENNDDTLIYFEVNSLSNKEKDDVIKFFINYKK